MTSFTVDLDDEAADRLRRRAEREGLDPEDLARRLLTEAANGDPFAFFDSGSSSELRGDRVDERLAEPSGRPTHRSSPWPKLGALPMSPRSIAGTSQWSALVM